MGVKYMKLWPQRPELSQYFSEYNTVQFARLVCKFSPGLAVFTLVFQIGLAPDNGLVMGLFYFAFILSFPVQALVMLGVQADKKLPQGLASWYKEGVARFNEKGGDMKLSTHKPRYFDLAMLLNITYQNSLK